jgi:hypothetical protein
MKRTYRFQLDPEISHNGNLRDFGNHKEELLEMIGFCEPGFETIECSQADRKEEISVCSVGSESGHHLSVFCDGMAHDVLLSPGVGQSSAESDMVGSEEGR